MRQGSSELDAAMMYSCVDLVLRWPCCGLADRVSRGYMLWTCVVLVSCGPVVDRVGALRSGRGCVAVLCNLGRAWWLGSNIL